MDTEEKTLIFVWVRIIKWSDDTNFTTCCIESDNKYVIVPPRYIVKRIYQNGSIVTDKTILKAHYQHKYDNLETINILLENYQWPNIGKICDANFTSTPNRNRRLEQ